MLSNREHNMDDRFELGSDVFSAEIAFTVSLTVKDDRLLAIDALDLDRSRGASAHQLHD
jgi:hypothetical protein